MHTVCIIHYFTTREVSGESHCKPLRGVKAPPANRKTDTSPIRRTQKNPSQHTFLLIAVCMQQASKARAKQISLVMELGSLFLHFLWCTACEAHLSKWGVHILMHLQSPQKSHATQMFCMNAAVSLKHRSRKCFWLKIIKDTQLKIVINLIIVISIFDKKSLS